MMSLPVWLIAPMFLLGVSVPVSMVLPEGFSPGGRRSLLGGVSVKAVSVKWEGVSVKGVSVKGGSVKGDLCEGVSVIGGVCEWGTETSPAPPPSPGH